MEVLVVEMFDVYDSTGKKTGIIKEKGQKLEKGQYKMAVNTWFMYNDKLFIQKRTKNLRTAPGKWASTSGGSVSGEEPIDTVVRECYEELGLKVSADKFILLNKFIDESYLIYVFIAHMDIDKADLNLQTSEVETVDWKTLEEIEKLIKADKFYCSTVGWKDVEIYTKLWSKI